METKSLRTVVVDDHALVRKNIVLLLERTGHAIVVGQAENGCTALTLIKELHPDLAVVDVLTAPNGWLCPAAPIETTAGAGAASFAHIRLCLQRVSAARAACRRRRIYPQNNNSPKLLPQAIEALLQGQTFFNSIGTTKTPPFLSEPEQYDYSEHKL